MSLLSMWAPPISSACSASNTIPEGDSEDASSARTGWVRPANDVRTGDGIAKAASVIAATTIRMDWII
ncbi:MAG TPA: hypothetical protein VKV29_07810 [Chthonomonas sp.]|uniref:hypothetical protein n=1 Tax=Chthonomonas sp. TaxID=2282153 RepID=UPI002B4B1738|nr:hypothetical protein [Chthonomonas sp.]HLH80173.1 hypothetical protein [Chthonomonas sp.]